MNLEPKYAFLFNTLTAFFFGLTFFLMPEVTASLMGITTDAQGLAALQFMGLGFLVTGVFVYSYRNIPHSTDRQIVFLALFLSYLGMIVLHILYHSLSNLVVLFAITIETILTILYLVLFIMNMKNS
jgi:hypothetical protein